MADLTAVAAALTTLRGLLLGTGSLAGADAATLAVIVAAANAAAAATNAAYAEVDTVLASSATGSVGAGTDGATNAANFIAYQQAAAQAPWLYDMSSYLTRILDNLRAGVV